MTVSQEFAAGVAMGDTAVRDGSASPPARVTTTRRGTGPVDHSLYVVEVDDQCLDELAGHTECSYASPPQPAAQALALVRALLASPHAQLSVDDSPWRRAIAGGRRTVCLHRTSAEGQLTLGVGDRTDEPGSHGAG